MAVSSKLKKLYMNFFETPELFAANTISRIQETHYLKKFLDRKFKLSADQKKQIKEFWKPYCKVSYKWAAYYCSKNGHFDPKYIPNTLHYTKIDQYFNNRKLGYGFNDKNYYSKIFSNIKQPVTLVRIINGMLFDSNYNQITSEDAEKIICTEQEIIIKPSQESGSGRSIEFLNTSADRVRIKSMLKSDRGKYKNYIVQAIISQHECLNNIHRDSVNTIRIATLLTEDKVNILSSVLRMGVDNSRIDNATAGGISIGIDSDGTLQKYAYSYYSGTRFSAHPQGFVFEGFKVPSYDKAVDLVKKAAPIIGNFRLVSWDIAIDDMGEALLIEANMRKGSINFHQFSNGSFFGDLTESVLNELFEKK